jgi:hypothetical protein
VQRDAPFRELSTANCRASKVGAVKPGRCAISTFSFSVTPSTCWATCRLSGVVEWKASSARSKPAFSCAFATVSIWSGSSTGPLRTIASEELLLEM